MHSTTILIKKLRKPRIFFCTKTNNAKMLYHAARLIHRKWHILQSFINRSALLFYRHNNPRPSYHAMVASGFWLWARVHWSWTLEPLWVKTSRGPSMPRRGTGQGQGSVWSVHIMLPSYREQSTERTCWVSLSCWSDTRIARCLSVSRSWKR